jgi:hypothetical protein
MNRLNLFLAHLTVPLIYNCPSFLDRVIIGMVNYNMLILTLFLFNQPFYLSIPFNIKETNVKVQ